MKTLKAIFILFIAVISIAIIWIILFTTGEKKIIFDDTQIFKNKVKEQYGIAFPVYHLATLLPMSAKHIEVIFNHNRPKNIRISFYSDQEDAKQYFILIDEKIPDYVLSKMFSSNGKKIFQRSNNNTVFSQIAVEVDEHQIKIETF